jgi:hypothetical protein
MSRLLLQYLPLAAVLIALLFFVRLLCVLFSRKIQDQMRRHRTLHCLWGCWALATAGFLYLMLYPSAWPPLWLERHTQRHEVLERVQSGGGWAALKRDCDSLAAAYRDDPYGFRWFRDDTNSLPRAIAALRPKEVEFYPRKVVRQFGGEGARFLGTNVIVRISIFGAHSTGGHDQPALGLDVLCEAGVSKYKPERLRSTTPLRYWRYRKVAADIYEFY